MGLFTFIVCFLILLLIVIIVGSIQQLSIWIVSKRNNEFVIMIIPALATLICFTLTLSLTYLTLNKLFDINTLSILFSIFMKFEYVFNDYISMLIGYVIGSVIFILLQALCLKFIYINYYSISRFIKYKILKKEEIKTLEASEEELEGKVSIDLTHHNLPAKNIKLSFLHYIAASLLTFVISFSAIFGLIYSGIMIGKDYIL